MKLDELMELLYRAYEEKDCNGDVPVFVSFYACGGIRERDMTEDDIDTSGEGIFIRVEDN